MNPESMSLVVFVILCFHRKKRGPIQSEPIQSGSANLACQQRRSTDQLAVVKAGEKFFGLGFGIEPEPAWNFRKFFDFRTEDPKVFFSSNTLANHFYPCRESLIGRLWGVVVIVSDRPWGKFPVKHDFWRFRLQATNSIDSSQPLRPTPVKFAWGI